jgi:hypothetical protein
MMGNTAINQYAKKYKIFLNMTSSKLSEPGYLRMGFFPIIDKSYITKYSLFGLITYILTRKKRVSMQKIRIAFGEFEGIVVDKRPRPYEMAELVAKQKYNKHKLTLFQNQQFFHWRFNNKRNNYVFYYCRKNKELTGYVVIGLSQNKRRGYILDYAEADEASIEKILKHIVRSRHFDIISIYNFNLNATFLQTLQRLSFKKKGLMRMIESRFTGEIPLFVRPVKKNYIEEDWHIGGLDIRDARNWFLKPICSDGV